MNFALLQFNGIQQEPPGIISSNLFVAVFMYNSEWTFSNWLHLKWINQKLNQTLPFPLQIIPHVLIHWDPKVYLCFFLYIQEMNFDIFSERISMRVHNVQIRVGKIWNLDVVQCPLSFELISFKTKTIRRKNCHTPISFKIWGIDRTWKNKKLSWIVSAELQGGWWSAGTYSLSHLTSDQ